MLIYYLLVRDDGLSKILLNYNEIVLNVDFIF